MYKEELEKYKLFKILDKKSVILSSEIINLFERVVPILERIILRFPEFTDHGILHSLAVLGILDWLIPRSLSENTK